MIETLGKALLFDIDGTLANTDPLHLKAFNQVLGPHGHVFDHARFSRELQGFANVSIGERFLPNETLERRAAILGEKEEVFRTLVAGQIEPLPGLMALLDRADDGRHSHGRRDQCAASQCRAAVVRPRHHASLQDARDRRRAAARQAASAALSGGACASSAPARRPRSRSRIPAPACSRPPPPAFRPSASGPASAMLTLLAPARSPPRARSTIPTLLARLAATMAW